MNPAKRNEWVPAIVPGLFIFLLCLLPGGAFPDVSWAAAFAPDKWVHAGLFAVWGLYWNSYKGRVSISRVFVITVLWGGFIEFFQEYVVTWRSGDWLDWAADAAGAGLAWVISMIFSDSRKKVA